mmetsp:Transcript_6764/g.15841  ORF Transcript_6764/g.15841 Transcript_6764/m.15841 type:complete len:268 (+) Transcript_6764:236-1039(+)
MLGLRASCRHVLKATSAVHQRPNSVMRRWYTSGDFKFEDIWKNNREWANSKRAKDPTFFERLSKGQQPKILWIGCADARVPANEIIGADSGAVFVQRNIANMVLSVDTNAQAVVQYAVEYLQVPHVIVCGHYDCGGIRAATRNLNHGSPLENWLRTIRNVYRLHHAELEQLPPGEERVRRLVELNVVEQCLNVYKTAAVQRRRFETKQAGGTPYPIIHGMVYDVANGELQRVQADMDMKIEEIQEMYDLYEFDAADREMSIDKNKKK